MSWQEFLDDHLIEYKKGSKDNLEIHCPMCGVMDHSMHMGVSTTSSKYGCWKDESHRGIAPARLIKELLGCSWDAAKTIATKYFRWQHAEVKQPERQIKSVRPPELLMPFGTDPRMEEQYISYLNSRGYDATQLIHRYQLRYGYGGPFAYRIIIPIIFEKDWYCWLGRSISPNVELRYKASDSKDGCTARPDDFLFDYDNLTGGKYLIVTEGVFDAMKIQSAFIPGVQATSLFGQNISAKQIAHLIRLAPKYEQILIGLDKDAYSHSMTIQSRLSWYIGNVGMITPEGKDWGDMSYKAIKEGIRVYASS